MGLINDMDQNDTVTRRVERSMEWMLGGDYYIQSLQDSDEKNLHDRLNHRLVSIELRRQQNLEAIIMSAYRKAPELDLSEQSIPSINDDWMARWLRLSGDIHDEDMHAVWADVLIAETTEPGQFSLSTLEKLSCLRPQELDLCRRVSHLYFPTGLIFKLAGGANLDAFGLLAEHIENLKNLDLMWQADDLYVSFLAPSKGLTLDYTGADLVLRHSERELFTFQTYKLTEAGRELSKLMHDGTVDADYLSALGSFLKNDGYDFRLKIKD